MIKKGQALELVCEITELTLEAVRELSHEIFKEVENKKPE